MLNDDTEEEIQLPELDLITIDPGFDDRLTTRTQEIDFWLSGLEPMAFERANVEV